MIKLAYGVGINDRSCPAWVEGKELKEYKIWQSLLARCYCPKVQERHPTYVGCTVSENFKNYSYFHEWCKNQMGFGEKGFELDKDLIQKGNKTYSEDLCLFLPQELNCILTSCRAARGNLPLGVTSVKNRFRARCHRKPARHFIGDFKTPELAFVAYKQAKEAFIKVQAEKWKAHIDPRAFAALMAYTILITD